MRDLLLVSLALALLGGCTALRPGEGSITDRYTGSRQLEQADALLEKGETIGATKALTTLANGPAVAGVTDEALFRLALLTLRHPEKNGAVAKAQQLLRRLSKEYPKSRWTRLAEPVRELVEDLEEQRRLGRNLKASNQSLNREIGELGKQIGELNKNIEQLKRLDVELEQKVR